VSAEQSDEVGRRHVHLQSLLQIRLPSSRWLNLCAFIDISVHMRALEIHLRNERGFGGVGTRRRPFGFWGHDA